MALHRSWVAARSAAVAQTAERSTPALMAAAVPPARREVAAPGAEQVPLAGRRAAAGRPVSQWSAGSEAAKARVSARQMAAPPPVREVLAASRTAGDREGAVAVPGRPGGPGAPLASGARQTAPALASLRSMAPATVDAVEMPGANRYSSTAGTSRATRHQLEPPEPTRRPELLARTRVVPLDAVMERPAVREPGQQRASASPPLAKATARRPA